MTANRGYAPFAMTGIVAGSGLHSIAAAPWVVVAFSISCKPT